VADNPAVETTVRLRALLAKVPDHGASTAPNTGAKRQGAAGMGGIAAAMGDALWRVGATLSGYRCRGICKS